MNNRSFFWGICLFFEPEKSIIQSIELLRARDTRGDIIYLPMLSTHRIFASYKWVIWRRLIISGFYYSEWVDFVL